MADVFEDAEELLSAEAETPPPPPDAGLPPWQYKADGPLLSVDEEVNLTHRARAFCKLAEACLERR